MRAETFEVTYRFCPVKICILTTDVKKKKEKHILEVPETRKIAFLDKALSKFIPNTIKHKLFPYINY